MVGGWVVACLIKVSLQVLSFENLTLKVAEISLNSLEKFNGGWVGGGLFDYSVTPGPEPGPWTGPGA